MANIIAESAQKCRTFRQFLHFLRPEMKTLVQTEENYMRAFTFLMFLSYLLFLISKKRNNSIQHFEVFPKHLHCFFSPNQESSQAYHFSKRYLSSLIWSAIVFLSLSTMDIRQVTAEVNPISTVFFCLCIHYTYTHDKGQFIN